MPKIEERVWKNGTINYRLIYYVDGERKTFSDSDRSKVEAFLALLEKAGPDVARKILRESEGAGPTLRETMLAHIKQLVDVGQGTIRRYYTAVDQHFDTIGQMRTREVSPSDVKVWVQELQRKGLSAKTIQNQHGLLSAAFKTAMIDRVIDFNPCAGIRLPKETSAEEKIRYITPDQWARIMQQIKPHDRPFFLFLYATGARFSEATALTPQDFNLDVAAPYVRISKAWKETSKAGVYELGRPKTKAGIRTVTIAPSVVETVRPLMGNPGLVFTNTQGHRITSSRAHQIWGPACKRAGYTDENKPRIHDIRHSHASYMLAGGLPIPELCVRLGHTSVQMSIDLYSHLVPDAHFRAINVAHEALQAIEYLPEIAVREWNQAPTKEEKLELTKNPDDPRHGTANFYKNYGCRCKPCCDANTTVKREARARYRNKIVEGEIA